MQDSIQQDGIKQDRLHTEDLEKGIFQQIFGDPDKWHHPDPGSIHVIEHCLRPFDAHDFVLAFKKYI